MRKEFNFGSQFLLGNILTTIICLCLFTLLLFPDPNTQILYACDSCGDKFLDASFLAQHVRIHTAQALVMFQADSDFYQYTATSTAEGESAPTWQSTSEHVIQEGDLIFRSQDGDENAEGGIAGRTTEEEEEGSEGVIREEEGVEDEQVETHTELQTDEKDVEEKDNIECESQA